VVFPIVRPRGGDFLYTDTEFETMVEDIKLIKSLGYKGAVIGFLNSDGSIDKNRTKTIVDLAAPMEITFHRAFDRCKNPLEAIEDLIEVGCKRVLTSAQVPNVMEGLPLLKALVEKAAGRIIILPGSGVRANNCKEIIDYSGAQEIHSSARTQASSKMEFNNPLMKENLQSTQVNTQEIKTMLAAFA
jgi:copper homeostasis protein